MKTINRPIKCLFIIYFFFLSGCAALQGLGFVPSTCEECINYYNTLPPNKALVLAQDNTFRWACGYSYGKATVKEALDVAYAYCNNYRTRNGVYSECCLYAINTEVVY